MKATIALLIALTPMVSFAKSTKGLEGLKRFDCTIVSDSNEIERQYPIAKTMLAESKAQATALYLTYIDANAAEPVLEVSVPSASKGKIVSDIISEVKCELLK